MEWFWVFVLISVFPVGVIGAIIATKDCLKEDSSKISIALASLNWVLCLIACVYSTSLIAPDATISAKDLNGNDFGIGSLVAFIFLWWIFSVLAGSILAVISENIASLWAVIKKDPNAFKRGYLPPGFETGSWTGLYAGSLATAYSMILYILGLSDRFFPLSLFV